MIATPVVVTSLPQRENAPKASALAPEVLQRFHSPALLAQFLREAQPARYRELHGRPLRGIVVDDKERTGARFARAIDAMYEGPRTEVMTDPFSALERVREMHEAGTPFDFQQLDMHMPGMTGVQFLQAEGDIAPATLFVTSSAMLPIISDLQLQMSQFQGDNAAALIAAHVQDGRPANLPLAPVFIHLKDEVIRNGWMPFINKLDSALLVHQYQSGTPSSLAAFLRVFKPNMIPITFTALAVHEFLEELRNHLSDVEDIIARLKSSCGLTDTAWWKEKGPDFEASFAELRQLTFRGMHKERPGLTWDEIHIGLGTLCELACPISPFASRHSQGHALWEDWQKLHARDYAKISQHSQGLRVYAEDLIDPALCVQAMCCGRNLSFWNYADGRLKPPFLHDKDGLLRKLLTQMVDLMSSRSEQYGGGINIDFTPEISRWGDEGIVITRALKKIQAGAYWDIYYVY